MYRFYEPGEAGGGAAVLKPVTPVLRPAIARGFGDRLADLRAPDIDLVTDLGVRIGSREWLRGAATCLALCYAAWSLAPDMGPIAGVSPPPLADAQWEQARALSISPLAYGADTGRRMAPTDAVEPLTDTPERPSIDLVATLGQGDGFERALERAGVTETEAKAAADLINGAFPLDDIKPGTALDLTLGRRPDRTVARPLDALTFRARFDLKISVERVDGKLKLTRIPIAVDETPLRIRGRVGASLYRAARAAGAPAKAVEAYLRAIATHVDVGDIGADYEFDLIIEHRSAATGETETGRLLYAGLKRAHGKDVQLMRWEQDGKDQWFEASGVGKTSGLLQRPVPGIILSGFGMRRHPILGYTRMHKGLDFRAAYGTPIHAATDGTVVGAGRHGGYGKQVRIKHGHGLATSYSHMSRIAVKVGAHVKRGQVIGYVGSTGLATGPHLHYELYRNGVAINPAKVKFTTREQLSGAELARFKSKLHSLLATPAKARDIRSAKTEAAGRADKRAKT